MVYKFREWSKHFLCTSLLFFLYALRLEIVVEFVLADGWILSSFAEDTFADEV